MGSKKLIPLALLLFSLVFLLSGCSPLTTNQEPTASFSADPSLGTAPLEVTFDAVASKDMDGHVVNYEWDFGDDSSGETSEEEVVTHTFSDPGDYQVELTVTDDGGASSSATKEITVTGDVGAIDPYLTVTGWRVLDASGEGMVVGHVKNTGSSEHSGLVEVRVYGSDEAELATKGDAVGEISAGETKEFYIYTGVDTGEIDHVEVGVRTV